MARNDSEAKYIIEIPEPTDLAESGGDLVLQAKALRIASAEDAEKASGLLLSIKAYQDEVKRVFNPIAKLTHAAHKMVIARTNEYLQPAIEAESIIKRELARWARDEELKRAEERRRLEERERKLAEERARAEAATLEAMGVPDEVVAEIESASRAQAELLSKPVEKVKLPNAATVKTYTAEVVDMAVFLRWVVEHPEVGLAYVSVNQSALNAWARATKGSTELPGVVVHEDTSIRVKR